VSFENPIFVAEGGFPRLREIGRILARVGIPSEVVAPPGACSTNA
jgi:hypothetical protein